ncbi:MAG: carboxypeptidase regulatory-like domain-containing protein, partial [Bacteroidia bacterium]|nr:carboxypeptidase regulatory-like domain-containing protein [Bacteroidia bacterium]
MKYRNNMKKGLIILLAFPVILFGQAPNWVLKLSSNVEIRNWKLTSKAEKEEKSLGGASIVLTKGGTVVGQTTSNGNGDFTIDVPPNGEYILTVSYPGYNTKKFAVNTFNVPEEFAKDNYKPTFSIGGFIMAKAFPGINYSGLQNPLVKVEFKDKKKVFDHDETVTQSGLNTVMKIYNDEDALIQKFCNTNKQGDIALAKPDCPLAKQLYESAMKIIPGEQYPVEQLAKVGQCLQAKEEEAKKAAEDAAKAKADAEAAAKAKAEADAKAKEEASAAAKAKAEADAKARAEAQAKAKEEANAKAKAEAELAAKKKEAEAKAKAEDEAEAKAKQLAKEKAAAEKAQKQKEGMAKAKAEDEAEAKAIEEKRKAKEAEAAELAKKKKEAEAKAKAEDEAEAKAIAAEKEAKRKAKEEEEKQKRLQYESENAGKEGEMKKGNAKYGIYNTLGGDKYKESI